MKTRTAVAATLLAALTVPAVSFAAPPSYQAGVTGNNPYLYYRLNETNVADESIAIDSSVNGRNGVYNGGTFGDPPQTGPNGGAAGFGPLSDTAVDFNLGTGVTRQYIRATNAKSHGSALGTSSYEFIYKYDNPASTEFQSLYGVFSNTTGGSLVASEITLNSQGNDALSGVAGRDDRTRLFIRDAAGAAVGASFLSPTLYDGNYHHLVYTFDQNTLTSTMVDADNDPTTPDVEVLTGGFAAYVDGIAQPVDIQRVGGAVGSLPTTFGDHLFDPTFVGRNVRGTGIDGNGVGRLADITLDEAVLYSTVLSPAQVAANATAAGFVVPEPTSLAALSLAAVAGIRRRRA